MSREELMNMTVAIIDTGKMGSGLARLLASKGIDVAIGHKDPTKAAALAEEIGSRAQAGGTEAAAKLADIVILAVPYSRVADALKGAGDLTGKIVIDISNPITSDFKALTVGHTTSAAEEIQKLVPGAKVVKAWNTIFAELLPPEAHEGRAAPVQVFIAGDDEGAKNKVSDLVKATGFEPVESGALSNCRYLEPVGELNIHFGFFLGWGTSAGPAWIRY
ncbi:MAG: NADPH-dependent F420 reductase [Gammaproteobacteria bacterium]